jgi:NagD protein
VTRFARPTRIYPGYVFDLDGTLYLGDDLLPGAAETVRVVRSAGARVAFLTNKPLELPVDYAAKLTRLGIPADEDDVVSSTDALRLYLRERAPGARIFAVSEPVVADLLRADGFELTDDPAEVDVVVVSFDRTFDYAKLLVAYRAVRRGARIVATNPDPYCPTPDGGLPDCAAMLAAIETASGGKAEAIVGKPSTHMSRAVLSRLGLAAEDVILVGDRLLTDVGMARAAGMTSALVLTGATSEADLLASEVRPDFVLNSVGELIPAGGRTRPPTLNLPAAPARG